MGCRQSAGTLQHAGCSRFKMSSAGESVDAKRYCFIALGSNLGRSRELILSATTRLQAFSDEPLLRSSLWQTTPVDCPPGSPLFVNAVVGFIPRIDETP